MEEQTVQTEVQPIREEALSWQFILVLVVIAAFIPLLASSFINNVERADPPPMPTAIPVAMASDQIAALAELPLTQTFEDPSGITVQYPESWYVLPLSEGFFVVSNYELDLTATEFPPDIVLMQVQSGQLSTFTLPDGSVPEPGTSPQAIMETLTADSPEPMEVMPRAIGETPAASIMMLGEGSVREVVMVAPTDTDLILIDTNTSGAIWEGVEPLVGRIIGSMTFALQSAE